jgi:hypothetical protein
MVITTSDLEVPGPKILCEPLQKQRVGIDEEDAFLIDCPHSNLLIPNHRCGKSSRISIEPFDTGNLPPTAA